MSESSVSLDTELRKLRPAELYTLGQILNISDSWKKLMAIVPKDDASNLPKFNTEHFSMIEQAAQQQRRNAAEIFLSEWGTMGRNRPTLRTLLNFLVTAELFRAADYVAADILKEELPRRPQCGPAAPVDISDEVLKQLLEEKEDFGNLGFNESLIFALPSDINDNETANPNAIDNETNDSSLERYMQSTKLISTKQKHNEKYSEKIEGTSNIQVSDLMKFSSEQNVQGCIKQVFEQQEMFSHELPVFLNEFGRSTEHMKSNGEVLSDDLPVFLNNSASTSTSNNISLSESEEQLNIPMHLSNLNIIGNEMNSTELPQCIVELAAKNSLLPGNDNTPPRTLSSQELPITVLEYNE